MSSALVPRKPKGGLGRDKSEGEQGVLAGRKQKEWLLRNRPSLKHVTQTLKRGSRGPARFAAAPKQRVWAAVEIALIYM